MDNKNKSELFAILVWLTVMAIILYQVTAWSAGEIEKINYRFKNMEDMMNGNP